jgi:hypothetical protein
MSESDDKPFIVNDRRHFTADGEARPAPETPPAAGPEEPGEAPSPAAPPDDRPRGAGAPAGPVDFGSFVLSLGAQAGALLSGAGADEEVSQAEALAHAQQIISILEMLQDKTHGRRTPDEDRLLEELLFQLRMAFVQKKRTGA